VAVLSTVISHTRENPKKNLKTKASKRRVRLANENTFLMELPIRRRVSYSLEKYNMICTTIIKRHHVSIRWL